MFREFAVARRRLEETRDRDITLAYHIAALTRGTKGLPKLETLLSKRGGKRGPRPQTPKEQVMMWQVAMMRFGGKLVAPKKVRIVGQEFDRG